MGWGQVLSPEVVMWGPGLGLGSGAVAQGLKVGYTVKGPLPKGKSYT